MGKILKNAIQTPDGTILESKYRHDYITYTDKNGKLYGVDGGKDYLRRIGDIEDCKDLSIEDDNKIETRRENLYWGVRYDKNGNLLINPKSILIKDLDTDHIKAILRTQVNIDDIYKETFIQELKYRDIDGE